MKKAGIFAYAALPILLLASSNLAVAEQGSNNAGALSLHPRFRSHLKCPYADKWLAKGPEQAALELGLDSQGRKLQRSLSLLEEQPVMGSCTYANTFQGGMTCLQFQGEGWTNDDMQARCITESGTLSAAGEGCAGDVAGWCDKEIADGKHEATAMMFSAMAADCSGVKMGCETFMSGTFFAAGSCATADSASTAETGGNIFEAPSSGMGGPPPGVVTGEAPAGGAPSWPGAAGGAAGGDDAMKCLLAPGAIGAAHQAGFSKGYSASCPNTPAQDSPYMWPLRWAADAYSQNMAYGSDEVVFRSRGRTFYMLDNNWKRSDTTYQEGALRTIGQGPCDDIDEDFAEEGFLGCFKNQTDGTMSTMIHKQNLMYFITWKDGETVQPGETDASKIEECSMINLAIIGNIRPDWFMDKRGDDTDVQYLGDQHVFYADEDVPKLVKQWRKKDFASQYFTMSMMGNTPNKLEQNEDAPVEDNIHWPLILNIPGEGFGDDSLQIYRNHALLTDEDEEMFKLIENFEALGGACSDARAEQEQQSEGGGFGPPVLEEEESIPSNLEVDPLAWVSNEVTFSPIWVMPVKEEVTMAQPAMGGASTSSSSSKSVLEVSNRITVESCYDEATSSMDMSIHFHDVEVGRDGLLPWMALGYRDSDLCAMTPPTGGVTPIVLVTQASEDVAPEAHKTQLMPEAKGMSAMAFESMITLMQPLSGIEEFAEVSVVAPMASSAVSQVARSTSSVAAEDTVSLHFKQTVEGDSEVMHLMYAIGMSSQLGIHTTRGCFEVQATPCAKASSEAGTDAGQDVNTISIDLGNEETSFNELKAAKSSAAAVPVGFMFTLFAMFSAMVI